MKTISKLRRWLIYQRFKKYTMIPKAIYMANLELVKKYAGDGVIVECGVWKGGMLAGMLVATKNHVHGFDSFEGLPEPTPIDGKAALKYWTKTDAPDYFDKCRASQYDVWELLKSTKILRIGLSAGWYSRKTFESFNASKYKISVLRLDCDWYDSVKICLENLYDKVIKGGIVICDDYYAYDGAARAVNEFISDKPIRVRELKGVCYFVKP